MLNLIKMAKMKTIEDLKNAVALNEIKAVVVEDKTFRLFIDNQYGKLCYFLPKSRKKGALFTQTMFNQITKFISNKKEDFNLNDYNWKIIQKYKKYSQSASFTNEFIRKCQNIDDYQTWVANGCKDLYSLRITTGGKTDGKLISLNRIAKKYPDLVARVRLAIANQEHGYCSQRKPFDGLEITIKTIKKGDDFRCYLNHEFKNCGNGYYYELINDNWFIGVDVD